MKQILRYISLIGILAVPFVPLVVANSLFFPFITGKNFMFRIVIEIVFAAWAALAIMDRSYRPRRSWIYWSFAAFVAVILIADLAGVYAPKSIWSNYERMEGWVTLAHLFAYFLAAATVLSTEKLWRTFFRVSFGANAAIVSYSLFQIGKFLTINQGGVRVDATFGNATYLAVFALFHIFLAALFMLRSRRGDLSGAEAWIPLAAYNLGFVAFLAPLFKNNLLDKGAYGSFAAFVFLTWALTNAVFALAAWLKDERVSLAVLAVANVFVLYHTATRGAIIGLIGGFALAAALIAAFERAWTPLRKASLGVIAALAILVAVFFGVRNASFVQNSPVLSRFASISMTEKTTLSRFVLWNMAVEGWKERPVFGWGQENFNYVFNKYFDPRLYNQEQWFDRTHNVIFDWLIAGGALGLLAYLAFFGSVVWYVWRGRREDGFSLAEKSVLSGLMTAYFIHNLFVFDNVTSYIMFVSVAAYVYARTAPSATSSEGATPIAANRFAVPVAAVLAVALIAGVNARPMAENRSLIEAISLPASESDITPSVAAFKSALNKQTFGDPEVREQLLSMADRAVQAQGAIVGRDEIVALAKAEGLRQLAETPSDARHQVIYSLFLAHAGDLKGALEHLTAAHELSPKKQTITVTLASLYASQRDFAKALPLYKEAYELDTSFLAAQTMYAAAAVLSGDNKLADSVLSNLAATTTAGSNDLLQAYFDTKQYPKLIELMKLRIEADPTNLQNRVTLAQIYVFAGSKQKAIAEIQSAIAAFPDFKDQGEKFIADIKAGKQLGQ